MHFFRKTRRAVCLAVVLLLVAPACPAEEALRTEDRGLDLAGNISVHYPAVIGMEDGELLKQINTRIQEDCRIREYLARAAEVMAGGSLRTEWKGGILDDVFSAAVSAEGTVESARMTHVWTGSTVDLRDGHGIALTELFTDGEAALEIIGEYLEDEVAPELSAHLLNSELLPVPERFFLEASGLTLLYPKEQLCTLSDRAGDIRVGWHVLREVLDLSEDGIPRRIGAEDMISLTADGAAKLRAAAAEGTLTGIPARLGDSVKELTDRHHLLTDPDGFEGGRLFSLEGGCFRGVYLMTDDMGRDWDTSRVEGIRMDDGCLWGLCVGETLREEWLETMGEPDGSAEISGEKAEMNRLEPGICDYYSCGAYQLRLYSGGDGTLISVVLAE